MDFQWILTTDFTEATDKAQIYSDYKISSVLTGMLAVQRVYPRFFRVDLCSTVVQWISKITFFSYCLVKTKLMELLHKELAGKIVATLII
jgi:hypothetical protein